MTLSEKYEERLAELPANNFRVGDVVLIYGKKRLVTFVSGGLIKTGSGRGFSKYWTVGNIGSLVVRNFKLKPGFKFDGVTG